MQRPHDMEAGARAYYDRIAVTYDDVLDQAGSRDIRRCFWQHAEAAFPQPSRLLDFGAGSGFDAEHLARLGHRVTAYDLSDGMLDGLRRRCPQQLCDGTIEIVGGALAEVGDALRARAPFDGVVSNFAVFSTIPRPAEVFRLFGELVRADGTVLIAIQNPWYPGDMRTRGFWRALARLPLAGTMRYPSREMTEVVHYTPGQIRRAARPAFVTANIAAPACGKACYGWRSPFRLVALRRA